MSRPEWDVILSAAMKNKPDEIKRLVEEEGISPSHANAVAQSALHIASLWGNGTWIIMLFVCFEGGSH